MMERGAKALLKCQTNALVEKNFENSPFVLGLALIPNFLTDGIKWPLAINEMTPLTEHF